MSKKRSHKQPQTQKFLKDKTRTGAVLDRPNNGIVSAKVRMIKVCADESGQRLDNFLLRHLKGVPKSLIYRIIRKGEVRVNKGRAKPDRKLLADDLVRIPPVRLSEKPPPAKPGAGLVNLLRASVLYETDELLAINKPQGLAVHGGSGVNMGLIEALRETFTECRYLELVHRLDKDTSGCILIAKKRSMLRHLQQLLREKNHIHKHYVALVNGAWPKRRQYIDAPLLKSDEQNGGRIVRVNHEKGKPALTGFEIIEAFTDVDNNRVTLVKAKPVTGRTHQIRVHAQSIGHALIGDEKYGNNTVNQQFKRWGVKRLFLHAASIEFIDREGNNICIEAPLAQDLYDSIEKLRSFMFNTKVLRY